MYLRNCFLSTSRESLIAQRVLSSIALKYFYIPLIM